MGLKRLFLVFGIKCILSAKSSSFLFSQNLFLPVSTIHLSIPSESMASSLNFFKSISSNAILIRPRRFQSNSCSGAIENNFKNFFPILTLLDPVSKFLELLFENVSPPIREKSLNEDQFSIKMFLICSIFFLLLIERDSSLLFSLKENGESSIIMGLLNSKNLSCSLKIFLQLSKFASTKKL